MSNWTLSDQATENTSINISDYPDSTSVPRDHDIPKGEDDRENHITDLTAHNIQWAFALVIIPCVSLPGILGNVSSLIVLYRHGFKKTSNILLAALTLADACYLIGVNNVASYVHDYSSTHGFAFSVNVCYFLYGLYRVYFLLELWGNWCSLTLPVLITMERLVAVFFPFKFPLIVTPNRTWRAVIVVFILWVPINVYYFFLEDLVFVEKNGQQIAVISPTILLSDDYYKEIYLSVSKAAIILTEPMSVLLVICGCLMVGVKVRSASVKRRKLTSSVLTVTQQMALAPASRTTWTLMIVCLVYTITIGSAFIIQIRVTRERDTNVDKVLETVVRLVKCLHSSCNFFIYIYMNRNFRETYRHIFGSLSLPTSKKTSVMENRPG